VKTSGRLGELHVPGAGEVTGVIGYEVDHVVEYQDGTVTIETEFVTRKAADDNIQPLCAYLGGA
jgi:hypothetical protein